LAGSPALGTGPVLVQGGADTSATAFVLPTTEAGLVRLELAFANNAFSLVGTPSDTAFRTTAFAGAVRNLWHESADAWSAQMREDRDTAADGHAGEPGLRFWLQGFSRIRELDQGGNFTAFGQTRTVDLSNDQDFFGVQAGLDLGGAVGDEGGFAFGVTGGYVDSNVNFAGAGDDLQMRAVNIGGYARFATGMFFINALAKYDHILDIGTRSQGGNFDLDLEGNLYGAAAEAGFRIGGSGFYLEPLAAISYVSSDLDGFAVSGTIVTFDNDHGLRGSAGARIGTTFQVGSGAAANLYAGAHYVHDFGGGDEIVLATGANSVRIGALEEEDYVRALVGLNISGAGSLSGFFEGNGEFLNEHQGYGLRAGVRLRF
jgi:outer membrane autotransporter protein